MKESRIKTIKSAIAQRIAEVVGEIIPPPPGVGTLALARDPEDRISSAIVAGKTPKLKSAAEILAAARANLAGAYTTGYRRQLPLGAIFHSEDLVTDEDRAIAEVVKKRSAIKAKLAAIGRKIEIECQLGKFDKDPTQALVEFDARIEALLAKQKKDK